MEYLNETRKAGETRLWPSLRLRQGKPAGYYSAWFGNFRKQLSGTPDFHSLRHTVRTTMTETGIQEPTQDRITGHEAQASVGTLVYGRHATSTLGAAEEAIKYPALMLHKVYAPVHK